MRRWEQTPKGRAFVLRKRAENLVSGTSARYSLAYRNRKKESDPEFLARAAAAQRRYRERHPEFDFAERMGVSVAVARQILELTP